MKNVLSILIILFVIGFIYVYSQSRIFKAYDISKSPISTFKKYCSRCHGNEGSVYGEGFADLNDDSLMNVIEEMMFGPALLNPDSLEIKTMFAYNKALKDKKPFAIVLNADSFLSEGDEYLTISLSPESKLEVDNNKIKIEKEDEVCKLFFDPKTINNIKITLTRNKVSASFNFPDELWTN